MEVQRLPRRLFYRWTPTGAEIEYPTNIPNPAPEIACDTVQVTVPPTLPNWFTLWALETQGNGSQAWRNFTVGFSITVPVVSQSFSHMLLGQSRCWTSWTFTNQWGQQGSGFAQFTRQVCGTAQLTPGNGQAPRRDLLVGTDRIINPTINAPCPTWRLAGGNCPPNSLDCGDCCLDCAAINTAVNGVTSSVLPHSAWRKR